MEDDGRAVYVSVCGRVERVDLAQMTMECLCSSVATRFDIGDRLRFTSDEDQEPEVTTDDQLQRLAHQRHTLRVVISDSALSDLEQRMWQLRQLQWGFFQDELHRVKVGSVALRGEVRQLRQMVESSSRREVELQAELLNERQLREKSEQVSGERHEALMADLRREQRQHDSTEATLRKEIEDVRQLSLKFSANSERNHSEVKGHVEEETRNRGKHMEALLAEWAGSQAEVRQALEAHRTDIDGSMQTHERHEKEQQRETSMREALEKVHAEKLRNVELTIDKLEGNNDLLDSRLQEAHEATRCEAVERATQHQELQWHLGDLRERSGLINTINRVTGFPSPATPMTLLQGVTPPVSPGVTTIQSSSMLLPAGGNNMYAGIQVQSLPTKPGMQVATMTQHRSQTPPPSTRFDTTTNGAVQPRWVTPPPAQGQQPLTPPLSQQSMQRRSSVH